MSVNLKGLIGKLNDTTRAALEGAAGLCLARTHYDIEIEHFLLKLLDAGGSDAARIFHQFSVDTSRLQKEIERSFDKLKSGNARTPAFSPSLLKLLTAGLDGRDRSISARTQSAPATRSWRCFKPRNWRASLGTSARSCKRFSPSC